MKEVIIATNNAHKVDEIRTALSFEGWDYRTLKEAGIESSPEETGTTFLDNARIKARAVYRMTGKAVLADDSGLVVDILGGAPGVYSSRYCGIDGDDEKNNERLLRELDGVPLEKRQARFMCVLVFIDENGNETVAEGTIEGRIGFEERGSGGFGYDPLFLVQAFDYSRALAEVSQEEKNSISHRGNALRELRKKLFVG